MILLRPHLVLAGLLAIAGAARADEPAGGPPPPSAQHAFDVAGQLVQGDRAVGTIRLRAAIEKRPGDPDGPDHWRLHEIRTWLEDGTERKIDATAFCDGHLVPVEGTLVETDAWGSTTTYAWSRKGDAYRVEIRSEERTPIRREAAAEADALTTLVALVLRGRVATADVEAAGIHLWEPGWDHLQAERPFAKATLTVALDGRYQGEPARVVEVRSDDGRTVVALDPETLTLRGIEQHPKGGPATSSSPRAEAEDATEEGDPFAAPARTAKACAMRVALAFLTADVDLFDATIHWPTLRANHPTIVRGNVSDEAFRQAIRAQFEAKKQAPQEPSQARAFLLEKDDEFQVIPNGEDEAAVTLPKAYDRLRLTVARFDAAWLLVRLPGT